MSIASTLQIYTNGHFTYFRCENWSLTEVNYIFLLVSLYFTCNYLQCTYFSSKRSEMLCCFTPRHNYCLVLIFKSGNTYLYSQLYEGGWHLFESENEWQKIEQVPIPLPSARLLGTSPMSKQETIFFSIIGLRRKSHLSIWVSRWTGPRFFF